MKGRDRGVQIEKKRKDVDSYKTQEQTIQSYKTTEKIKLTKLQKQSKISLFCIKT